MTEAEFIQRWEQEKPIYKAWSDFLSTEIQGRLAAHEEVDNVSHFIKIPVEPRLKETSSLTDKAFRRDKNYNDPYGDITDKVGMRFVVLLTADIGIVKRVIEEGGAWTASLDRDYITEREKHPTVFTYQSVHYVARAARDLDVSDIRVPEGTPCEIQIRTLLQHAYSEVAHDVTYKPKQEIPVRVHRAIARSMALIEAADESFDHANEEVNAVLKPARRALAMLVKIYREMVGEEPEIGGSNLDILQAYPAQLTDELPARIRTLLIDKPFLVQRIKERSPIFSLYRQASILLVYMQIRDSSSRARREWPHDPAELKPMFSDLGVAFR